MGELVGFQVTGDVIGGASLVHAASGRLLKALSDGGVDFYAVSAAIQLGKCIWIDQSQEHAVIRAIEKKQGSLSSYLNAALRLGWGHRAVAVELSRTRAGTSALMLIGILATGTSSWNAACALSELMRLHGCEADRLPTTDSLERLVDYLSPFVGDGNFENVHQKIHSACERGIKEERTLDGTPSIGSALNDGSPAQWAGSMKHLIDTAQAEEDAHIQTTHRIAWLAAYAAFGLKMAVKVVIGGSVSWESPGNRGSATLYNASAYNASAYNAEKLSQRVNHLPGGLVVLPDSISDTPLDIEYSFDTAFDEEFGLLNALFNLRRPRLRNELCLAIISYARNTLRSQKQSLWFPKGPLVDTFHAINGAFLNREESLKQVLAGLNILRDDLQNEFDLPIFQSSTFWSHVDDTNPISVRSNSVNGLYGFCFLAPDLAETVTQACIQRDCLTEGHFRDERCICDRFGFLITSFAAAALALTQCAFDPAVIRLQRDAFRSDQYRNTDWIRATFVEVEERFERVELKEAFEYLQRLVLPLTTIEDMHNSRAPVAASDSGYSLFYRALFEKDCFDTSGRTLAIIPGLIDSATTSTGNTFKAGTVINRIHAEGSIALSIEAELQRSQIAIALRLQNKKTGRIFRMSLGRNIAIFLANQCTGKVCQHDPNEPFKVPHSRKAITGFPFGALSRLDRSKTEAAFFMTADNPLEQVVQLRLILMDQKRSDPKHDIVLQGDSCLRCIYTSHVNPWVIM